MDSVAIEAKYFTPGPTPIPRHILALAAFQPPYNRTRNFSNLTFEILDDLKYVFQTSGDVVILTASGTGAMEAAILGFLNPKNRTLIINAGTFGQRWVDICQLHGIPFEEIRVQPGKDLSVDIVEAHLKQKSFTALLMTSHETSTGALYDVAEIGKAARRYNTFFMVDAISSICADEFLMDRWFVDVAILSSQKALALPPGLSFVALNQRAKMRLKFSKRKSFYFDLSDYLQNQKRGQMPFTPAISLFGMLRQRLKEIRELGITTMVSRQKALAHYFRTKVIDLPFTIFPDRPSNAMTALQCSPRMDAFALVEVLENTHNVFVASNVGELKSSIFRVSHMGAQSKKDVNYLIRSLRQSIVELEMARKKETEI